MIEVVVSLLLLGIVLGAVIGAFVMGSLSTARVKHRITAINLARAKMEAVKGTTYAQIPAQVGTEPVTIDQGSAAPGDELAGQRSVAVLDVYGDTKQYRVTVAVTWTEKNAPNPLEERIITLISQR